MGELVQIFINLGVEFFKGLVLGLFVGIFLAGFIALWFFRRQDSIMKHEREAHKIELAREREGREIEVKAHEREVKRLKEEITELYLRLGELR